MPYVSLFLSVFIRGKILCHNVEKLCRTLRHHDRGSTRQPAILYSNTINNRKRICRFNFSLRPLFAFLLASLPHQQLVRGDGQPGSNMF